MIPFICSIQGSQIHRGRKQNGDCQGLWGKESGELVLNADRVSVWEDEKVLEVDDGDGCTAMRMNLMSVKQTFKMNTTVNCMLFVFYRSLKKSPQKAEDRKKLKENAIQK